MFLCGRFVDVCGIVGLISLWPRKKYLTLSCRNVRFLVISDIFF
jgi:hypothetical protein